MNPQPHAQASAAPVGKSKPIYKVTKQFTGGLLKGLTLEEMTPVNFEIGFVCLKPCGGSSPYRVLDVKEVLL